MSRSELAQAVQAFARATVNFSNLESEWPRQEETGVWRGYGDTRDVFFRVYLDLRQLATRIVMQRTSNGPAITTAQRILSQHHIAYRDLLGALVGMAPDEIDRVPAPGEWPLRTVLAHIMRTERGFMARIHFALDQQKEKQPIVEMPEEQVLAYGNHDDDPLGSLADILARYDALHGRVLSELRPLTDAELTAQSLWWEEYPVEIRFRMHRFDAHLREHTIQVDKTLIGIGHPPTEPERLLRLIYQALGEVEGALIGASDAGITHQLTEEINTLAADVK